MRKYYITWFSLIALIALSIATLLSSLERQRMLTDAKTTASTLASSIGDYITLNSKSAQQRDLSQFIQRLKQNSKYLVGISICSPASSHFESFPKESHLENQCLSEPAKSLYQNHSSSSWIEHKGALHLIHFFSPLESDGKSIILTQDASQIYDLWLQSALRTFFLICLSGLVVLFMITKQMRDWLREHFRLLHHATRAVVSGKHLKKVNLPPPDSDEPFSKEISKIAANILSLRQTTDQNRKNPSWLESLRGNIGNKNLIVISNREPYIHQSNGNTIQVVRPASGLVTALEPILKQFGGRWIAHGSGNADFQVINEASEILVPPGNPKYVLQRVSLTKEEEEGYYYGFSNEGLWPLCHLAHNRPTFRLGDWEKYVSVNEKFAMAIPDRTLEEESLILVQDYHFALLPRLLKNRAQGANRSRIGLFWHIPWPNPEAFGICPWNKEVLIGMLGSDVIGFHTQYHCNNFLETCNRYLEARIDYENFSVTMDNHETFVKAFPIGIDTSPVREISAQEVKKIKETYGIQAEFIAVGVDRLDYTKGLVERVEAIGRFLEKHPEFIGKFTFVQMGSPSRTHIPAYQHLADQLNAAVKRVNDRYGTQGDSEKSGYLPIVLLAKHHEWDEIQYFYQMGDVCLVTSLHDGMNLVAKEYVWCQQAERGALILSKFAGASRELTEGFIVNPYSTEELADALYSALTLSPAEKKRRMNAMKDKIRAHSALHWASDLILALQSREESVATQPLTVDRSGNYPLAGNL